MKVDFYIRYSTRFGQRLFLTGNLPELGDGRSEDAVLMNFLNEDWWHLSVVVAPAEYRTIHYRYLLKDEEDNALMDGEQERIVSLKNYMQDIAIYDTWVYSGATELAFYTAPFRNIYLKHKKTHKVKEPKSFSHLFRVKAPLLKEDEIVCLTGSAGALGNWSTEGPVLMSRNGDWWEARVDLLQETGPVAYKYGVYDCRDEKFVLFEQGDNRLLFSDRDAQTDTIIVHDGFLHLPHNTWKGAGVAIPVFSLRSTNSLGVGEFTDIKLLADWAKEVGFKLIQLLPVNDTSATFTAKDSYPYAAISAFALHPIYINIEQIAGKKATQLTKTLAKRQKELNSRPDLDYENIINLKLGSLRELYEADEGAFLEDKEYQAFYQANKHWLVPYAAFCVLRDKWGTSDFNQWQTNAVYDATEIALMAAPKSKQFKQLAFWFYVQFHLHQQLLESVAYAHKKGLAIKGDIPIGIYRYGCDAWMAPDLYNMDQQAGAPPDDFAVKGQNWGFPTYNWQRMEEDHFEWWRLRFRQMSYYFDAFRIDHILGFFRIWSIPLNAVEGILGRFVPALPIHINEFNQRGIWFEYERFCKPHITDAVLEAIFGEQADYVRQQFLIAREEGAYQLQELFDTQRKVEDYFSRQQVSEENNALKQGLFDLISNIILIEHPDSGGQEFHFRISMEDTASYQHLDEHRKALLKELYIDYFYHRQDDFWKKEALHKLPALKEATSMLICGEDLGMVPHSVPEVMHQLGILSLEVQRMPKNPLTEFFHPKDAPYLSVITPSTHDMSTVRGWWEESREKTQRFYNHVLESWGDAPYFCEPWVNRAVVLQHLYSPAMWSIFQLQDLLGMNNALRRENPHEERINNPADPNHYWNYRMHLTLEDLLREKEFNTELLEFVRSSRRK